MLEQYAYVPILHTRQSEMRAYLQLPAVSKDLCFPIFVSRPWPNASSLDTLWERLSEAVGNRRYGLDLDAWKRGSNGREPAASDFNSLFDESDGYSCFYEAVEKMDRAIPVLRSSSISAQASHIERLDRGCILRIQNGKILDPNLIIDDACEYIRDIVFVVDVGWGADLLSKELWASSVISHIIEKREEAEIVIAGSSFPEEFSDVGSKASRPVLERSLYDSLVRRHNQARLVYGDWGSTRPPSDGGVRRSVPRLDLPMAREWLLFRRNPKDDESEDFRDIANRVREDNSWRNQPNIWGTYTIISTADNLPGAIRGAQMAASARVNIHLHKQALFGMETPVGDSDEPFTDDL